MRQHSLWKIGVAVLAGSLALSACGSRDDGGDDPTDAPETSDAGSGGDDETEEPDEPSGEEKVITIGLIAPLTGDLAALGVGMQNSVQLAVDQANESGELEGVLLEFMPEDDQANVDAAQQAASLLADESTVVGVVGTLNSSTAQSAAPVLNTAGITMVSPANTNPTLTLGEDWTTAPARVWDTYFRTCTTDNSQGRFAARYVIDELGITTAAVIHDQKTYGEGLSAVFREEFEALGGTITTTEVINPDEDDYSGVIATVAATNPGLVYYGGEYPQAAPLSSQLAAGGLDVPLMGGDGIYSGDFLTLGGREGDVATSVGEPTAELDSAAAFVEAYDAAGFDDPFEAYGGYAYDSANAIIEAIKAAVAANPDAEGDDLRAAVLEAMGSVDFDGATGGVSFDEFGDTTNRTLTVYNVEGGEWVPVLTGEYDPNA